MKYLLIITIVLQTLNWIGLTDLSSWLVYSPLMIGVVFSIGFLVDSLKAIDGFNI